jgi:aspartokinase
MRNNPIIVQKYGGACLETPAKIRAVAKRTVTAVRGRLNILKVSLHKVGRSPKKNPPA